VTGQTERMERVYSRLLHKENLRMWGKLYLSKTGRTVGGWLVDSWSENGAPYWRPKMHWFDKNEDKLNHVYLHFDLNSMQLAGEDTDVEPERAKFIRETVGQWEKEWLQEQGKS
jgi:hypothetical protein